MVFNRRHLVACAVLAGAIIASGRVQAQSVPDTGEGWITNSAISNGNSPSNNYFAGFDTGFEGAFRNHFDFSIPTLSGTLLTASLELVQPASVGHAGPPTTYSVYNVGPFGTYTFASISSGALYGSTGLDATSDGTTVTIALGGSALTDITAAQGGAFSVGGVDSGETNVGVENGDFAASEGPGAILVLTTGTVSPPGTPEPGTLALLVGVGAFGLGLRRARKNKI